MALLMVQYLSGGAWGLFARRVFEASARTVPVMAVLFAPIALSLPVLYEWARPEAATIHEIQTKAGGRVCPPPAESKGSPMRARADDARTVPRHRAHEERQPTGR